MVIKEKNSPKKKFVVRFYNLVTILFILLLNTFSVFAQDETTSDSTNEQVIVRTIIITGNKTTQSYIIRRELIFHQGDTLNKYGLNEAITRSKENLMNLGLFHSADMELIPDVQHTTSIHIHVSERWYVWPLPIFELVDRNFNEWWSKRDLKRTNYGMYLTHDNFRGRDEALKILVRLGYSQRVGIFYSIPYINRNHTIGLSFGGYYTRNHEIAYTTLYNKLEYVKNHEKFMRDEYYAFAKITARSGFNKYNSAFVDYRKNDIADTVVGLNKDYFVNQSTMQQQISVGWNYRDDKRDYQTYPLKGNVFELEILKQGIGVLKNEPSILSIASGYRKYWELTPRWHFASSVKGKISSQDNTPYFNQKALGYGADFIRGYEYYVINGQNYFLLKSNAKFTLLPTKVIVFKFLNTEKFNRMPHTFFINLFFDAGYVRDRQFSKFNSLTNSWQYGYGAGLDYLTYYDIVFRFEYSINRMGERGFFLHFSAPI